MVRQFVRHLDIAVCVVGMIFVLSVCIVCPFDIKYILFGRNESTAEREHFVSASRQSDSNYTENRTTAEREDSIRPLVSCPVPYLREAQEIKSKLACSP